MVQHVGEAALNLDLEPLRDAESLAQAGRQIHCAGTGHNADTGIAETANRRHVAGRVDANVAVELIGAAGYLSGANEGAAVYPIAYGWIRQRPGADTVRTLRAVEARASTGGIAPIEEGRHVRAGLQQQNIAEAPAAEQRIYQQIRVAHVGFAFAKGQFVHGRCDQALVACAVVIGTVLAAVQGIHDSAVASLPTEAARVRTANIIHILGKRIGRGEDKAVFVAAVGFHLQRVVGGHAARVAAFNAAPVRERPAGQRLQCEECSRVRRLIQVGREAQVD